MTTRTKFIIAGAIVAALAGLIVIDVTSGSGKKNNNATPKLAGKAKPSTPAPRVAPTPPEPTPTIESTQDPAAGTTTTVVVPTTPPPPSTTGTGNSSSTAPSPRNAVVPPTHAQDSTPAPLATTYEVKSGDSFWKIAQKTYGDGNLWKQIADANPTVEAHTLRPGMKLAVPAKREPARRATRATPDDAVVSTAAGKVYTIKAGDVFWNIAKANAHGRNVMEVLHRIEAANPGVDAERLQIGMQIVIPD